MALDSFHIAKKFFDPAIFLGDATGWRAWQKPRGARQIIIYGVSSGSGGGGGFTGASLAARGGGAGGAGGMVARLVIPAMFLPDIIYILAGGISAGSTGSGVAGTSGNPSFVSVAPNTTAANVIICTGTAQTGGGAGTGAGGGSASSAGTVFAVAQGPFVQMGSWVAENGLAGGPGGSISGAAGGSITALNGRIFSSGAGGGSLAAASNTDFAGGAITAAGIVPGVTAGASAAGAGQPGSFSWKPLYGTGGSGGGTAGASGTGGRGGDGAYGCGGGGGGAGVTGGAGGNGGPGFVIISVD